MKRVFVFAASAALASCATVPPHMMSSSFDPNEVAWFNGTGSNSLRGNAVLRTVGGDIRTCAGFKARIWPVSRYAVERVTAIYGSPDGGYAKSIPTFDKTDSSYAAAERTTTCDSQGNFEFTGLPDGDYYVSTIVTWGVPMGYGITSTQGGTLAQKVSLRGGETKNIVLTSS